MPVKKLGEYKIPFRGGNLQHYPSWRYSYEHVGRRDYDVDEWRDNAPVFLCLELADMASGRSAKYVIWKDSGGHTYPMFVVDLLDMLQHTIISHGVAVGYWAGRKRGENYGLIYLGQHLESDAD